MLSEKKKDSQIFQHDKICQQMLMTNSTNDLGQNDFKQHTNEILKKSVEMVYIFSTKKWFNKGLSKVLALKHIKAWWMKVKSLKPII